MDSLAIDTQTTATTIINADTLAELQRQIVAMQETQKRLAEDLAVSENKRKAAEAEAERLRNAVTSRKFTFTIGAAGALGIRGIRGGNSEYGVSYRPVTIADTFGAVFNGTETLRKLQKDGYTHKESGDHRVLSYRPQDAFQSADWTAFLDKVEKASAILTREGITF